MGEVVMVKEYPKCDFCNTEAHYDAKTKQGPWAYMCERHFRATRLYNELGTGKGQRLVKEEESNA